MEEQTIQPIMNNNLTIWKALLENDLEMIEFLLKECEFAVNERLFESGLTPLHVACCFGSIEAVEILLRYGAKVNARSNMLGWTSLHFAAAGSFVMIVNRLIQSGADISIQDQHGDDVLKILCKQTIAIRNAPKVDYHGRVFSWGSGLNYSLGHGDDNDVSIPKLIKSLKDEDMNEICVGRYHTLATSTCSKVWSWGASGFRLGTNNSEMNSFIGHLCEFKAEKIALNDQASAFINDGIVRVCGEGNAIGGGQIAIPKTISLIDKVIQIAMSNNHLVMLTNEHLVYCMGSNKSGQLAQKREGLFVQPQLVLGLSNIDCVAAANDWTIAANLDKRKLVIFGAGDYQVRDLILECDGKSIRPSLSMIVAGESSAVMLNRDGRVFGLKSIQNRNIIQLQVNRAVRIATGGNRIAVSTSDHMIYVWQNLDSPIASNRYQLNGVCKLSISLTTIAAICQNAIAPMIIVEEPKRTLFDDLLKYNQDITTTTPSSLLNEQLPIPESLIEALKNKDQRMVKTNMRQLYETRKLSDAIICTGQTEYQVHRFVFASRSEYFAIMWSGGFSESINARASFPTVTTNTIIEILIEWMYLDQVNIPPKDALEVYLLAHQLMIEPLQRLAEIVIAQHIDDVLAVYELAKSTNSQTLMRVCCEYFCCRPDVFLSQKIAFNLPTELLMKFEQLIQQQQQQSSMNEQIDYLMIKEIRSIVENYQSNTIASVQLCRTLKNAAKKVAIASEIKNEKKQINKQRLELLKRVLIKALGLTNVDQLPIDPRPLIAKHFAIKDQSPLAIQPQSPIEMNEQITTPTTITTITPTKNELNESPKKRKNKQKNETFSNESLSISNPIETVQMISEEEFPVLGALTLSTSSSPTKHKSPTMSALSRSPDKSMTIIRLNPTSRRLSKPQRENQKVNEELNTWKQQTTTTNKQKSIEIIPFHMILEEEKNQSLLSKNEQTKPKLRSIIEEQNQQLNEAKIANLGWYGIGIIPASILPDLWIQQNGQMSSSLLPPTNDNQEQQQQQQQQQP